MTDLLTDYIKRDGNYRWRDVAEIKNFFAALGLPEPSTDEFFHGAGKRIVFLSQYGIAIRITPSDLVAREDNPHFLKSLFNKRTRKYDIDIDPGLKIFSGTYEELRDIRRELKRKYGIQHDWRRTNLAYLPGTSYVILLDLDSRLTKTTYLSFYRLSRIISDTSRYLATGDPIARDTSNPQSRYDPLRAIITQGWPEYQQAPTRGVAGEFFRACMEFKARGLMVSDWETYNYFTTMHAARRYAEKLQSLPRQPHLA